MLFGRFRGTNFWGGYRQSKRRPEERTYKNRAPGQAQGTPKAELEKIATPKSSMNTEGTLARPPTFLSGVPTVHEYSEADRSPPIRHQRCTMQDKTKKKRQNKHAIARKETQTVEGRMLHSSA